jgi:DMSO/TMAO reductase YedYZ molybdopterin-dependent catalytic subunit
MTRIVSVLLICSGSMSLCGQDSPVPAVALDVKGDVPRPLKLSTAEIARLPRHTLRARDHDGKESEFAGVALVEVLKTSGLQFGKDLRGQALATYLVVEASDGYRAVFALPELDPAFTDRVILLADHRDGKPLGAKEGPLRIVVPGEKRQARWVRQVIALKVGKG